MRNIPCLKWLTERGMSLSESEYYTSPRFTQRFVNPRGLSCSCHTALSSYEKLEVKITIYPHIFLTLPDCGSWPRAQLLLTTNKRGVVEMKCYYHTVNAHPDDPTNCLGSHLFDSVRVDCGLWLQYADWFWFLGALGHLANFLRNEVVDTIEGFDRTLYQTDSFCCSCYERAG